MRLVRAGRLDLEILELRWRPLMVQVLTESICLKSAFVAAFPAKSMVNDENIRNVGRKSVSSCLVHTTKIMRRKSITVIAWSDGSFRGCLLCQPVAVCVVNAAGCVKLSRIC